MGRSPCCDKSGLKKGPWTPEEDTKLTQYIEAHGAGNWRNLPKNAGLQRCGKSCRLRWTNYLRPDIKRGRFSFEEEETIIQLHSVLGNKWSSIAARLPGRTDNEIKNYWNTHIRKRLLRSGIDPVTHTRRLDFLDLSSVLGGSAAQLNIPNLLRLLNPEALRLAMSLVSSSSSTSNQLMMLNSQLQNQQVAPPIKPNHFENIIHQQTPQNFDSYSFQNQSSQLFQHNLMPTTTNGSDGQSFPTDHLPSFGNGVSDQVRADLSEISSYESMIKSNMNSINSNSGSSSSSYNNSYDVGLESVVSTPLSTPPMLNSASTLINGEGEDERGSFCSDYWKFEIPESWNLDDFL